jgi:uncharacterized membrane protein
MSDAPSIQSPAGTDEGARIAAIGAYVLFLLAFVNGITAIVGLVIAYVKRGDTRGSIYYSHFNNLITTFWVTLVVGFVLMALAIQAVFGTIFFFSQREMVAWYLVPAIVSIPAVAFGLIGLGIFYLYRTVKGLVRLLDGHPYA